MTEDEHRRHVLSWPAQVIVVIYIALDELGRFVFRPFNRWLNSLSLVAKAEAWIAGCPPYVVLVLLVVPFGIAEFVKLFAVLAMSTGHFVTGVVIFILAYIVSLLVVDRIYHAGRAKLLQIAWFARLMDWLVSLRDSFLAWARETAVWQKAHAMMAATKAWGAQLKRRFSRA
jgi:hypothetical protein